jgi:hypothetical protein
VQEKEFFTEKTETKSMSLRCSSCRQDSDHQIRWITRTKKPTLPPRADADDRIRFQNARNYMIRVDDIVACPKCRKRIEITGQSVIIL